MGLHKGTTNNPNGRPFGTRSRNAEAIRATLLQFIDNNLETLQSDFEQLEPDKRLMFLERLLKHCVPPPVASILQFSDEEIKILINRLKNSEL